MPKRKAVPTQEAAKEAIAEARAEVKPKVKDFIVYAEFDDYKIGDVFQVPDGWKVDTAYTEMLLTKQKARQGVVFSTPTGRSVLPVREA